MLTHLHAGLPRWPSRDARSGASATICLWRRGHGECPFRALKEGDSIDLGRVRLQTLATPGPHPRIDLSSRGSISIAATSHPYAVLTGDTPFVGDVGRPDLACRSSGGRPFTRRIGFTIRCEPSSFHCLMTAWSIPLTALDRSAARPCGNETFTTIGEQRRWNCALQPMSRDAFVELLTTDLPDAPAYFAHDGGVERKERPTARRIAGHRPDTLRLEHVLERQRDGAQILDTREPEDFAAAHLVGGQNIGLGGQYATWAGTILGPDRPIVIIADPGREQESAVRLGRIGFDNVVGYLRDGLQSLVSRPDR